MVRRTQSRRGVVILIVLSLLVLFVLLVVTFAIVAGQYRRAAQAVGRREWLGEDPQKTADRVMYAVVREPDLNHTGSPFRGHGLLTDVYGRYYKSSVYGSATSRAGGQIVEFNFLFPSGWTVTTSEMLRGYFNGSVLSFVSTSATSQALQGVSTRVVAYAYTAANPPNPAYGTLRIVNPQNDGTTLPLPQDGDTFVLNGKPFVGTGFGYDSSAPSGTPRLTEHALKPNRRGDSLATLNSQFLAGLANESYDAADYQNMIMAAVAYDPDRTSTRVLPSFHREELIKYWASRDTSMTDTNGWNMLGGDTDTRYTDVPAISLTASPNNIYSGPPGLSAANRELRHRLVFRPMPWDHPNFTGSNVAFDAWSRTAQQIDEALTTGRVDLNGDGTYDLTEVAWDVDNDGDGIKDSIWIDPDLPLQTTEDGRTFRPLVAIHCVDLGGRLNVNAHGNYVHTSTPSTLVSVGLPGPVSSSTFPKGQGYGPPEVNLNWVIGDNAQYQLLLQKRYGTDGSPGVTGYDALMPFKFYEYPGNYFSANFWLSTYFDRSTDPATPFQALGAFSGNMDLRGVFACGVDHRGQPLYEYLYDSTTSPTSYPDQLADSPYELNLNSPSGADAPFTVAELEKVLRHRDFDASALQSRLTDLAGLNFLKDPPVGPTLGPLNRQSVTTDSWDIPVPGVVAPDGYPAASSSVTLSVPPQSIVEVLANRLYAGGVAANRINTQIATMLSPDLAMGLRMDVNRPIGNGRDDNSNAVVDEAYGVGAFAALNESLGPEYAKNGNVNIMAIDHDNDGVINPDPNAHLARGYLARHLFVLLMLVKDPAFYYDADGDGTPTPEETAQVLAQWAVNAVDFRDADSTMTPFEYDWNPFDGWAVDGNVHTNDAADGADNDGDGQTDDANEQQRRVVWGCERPELLISETLAFHDRRTEDLTSDPTGQATTDAPPNRDDDFDQRLAPRGALFVELYNPWAGHDKWPGEFYHTGTAWSSGVLLNKTNSAGQPVWRLAITDSDDPEALDPDPTTFTTPDPERTVYFTDPTSLTGGASLGIQQHFTTVAAANIAPLLPGRYAVVGTAGASNASPYVTTIGRRTDAGDAGSNPIGTLGLSTTRQITLTPSGDPNVNQVEVRNNITPPAAQGDAPTVDSPMDGFATPPAQVQPAIAIPIDVVLSAGNSKGKGKGKGKGGVGTDDTWLSISEPIGGYGDAYATSIWDPALADGEGAFEPPIDEPIDVASLPQVNGTLSNHRRIHLQRLANPLAPYNAETNPYLTIDVMPVDLTIFNGVESAVADPSIAVQDNKFGCFQRGANNAVADRYLWPQEQTTFDLGVPPAAGLHRFDFLLRNTLGYLNSSYGTAFDAGTAPAAPPFAVTSYVGAPNATSGGFTFPWLTWNNRPYASPTELLLVPRSSSSRLLRDFTVADTAATVSPYDPTGAGRFHHLLNLFAVDPDLNDAPNLYRLFEYLTVQPRFAGTETLLNPSTTSPHFGSNAAGTDNLHPPFNGISAYREPGRINLNTIFPTHVSGGNLASSVWDGVWGTHQKLALADFVDNRRGYGTAGGNLFTLDSAVPTYFANPYRATGAPLLVPRVDTNSDGDAKELARFEVDSSILRTNRANMGLTPALATTDVPRFMNAFTDVPRNSERNPYFSYQALQRLSNLVTCRSNVYALWLTIGYFEVDPVYGQLGQEVGLDTGTVQRHRAFYIIDRSIPVAFEPGQNHNVDKCVVLRRFIE